MKSQQTEITTNIIQSKFNTLSNYINIMKSSKTTRIHTKLLQKQEYLKNFTDYQNNDRSLAQKSEENGLSSLFLNNSKTKYLMSDLFFNKNQNSLSEVTDKHFTLLSPKLISKYITNQLNRMTPLKRLTFRTNLNNGILKFSYQILNRFKNNIVGLKIICSGKWKKTRSGRKQKLMLKFGRIRNPNISNVTSFHYAFQKTKYGLCGVKVWISHTKSN